LEAWMRANSFPIPDDAPVMSAVFFMDK
jgi:hypothetical protein